MPQNAASTLRPKALAILREGRLTVISAETPPYLDAPAEAIVTVKSSRPGGPTYVVDVDRHVPGFSCTCGSEPCAHAAAARLVLGRTS